MDDWRDLKGWPQVSGVYFLTPASLSILKPKHGVVPKDVARAVTDAAQAKSKFVYAWQRSPKATIYFLFGRDEARLLEITHHFSDNDAPFNGLNMAE